MRAILARHSARVATSASRATTVSFWRRVRRVAEPSIGGIAERVLWEPFSCPPLAWLWPAGLVVGLVPYCSSCVFVFVLVLVAAAAAQEENYCFNQWKTPSCGV